MKTVFVVGAGASADFNFPLGGALAADIRNRLDEEFAGGGGQGDIHAAISMTSGFLGEHYQAIKEIRGGLINAPSIDFFLETRSDRPLVVEVGKIAIAAQILRCEEGCYLRNCSEQDFDATQIALRHASNTWAAVLFSGLVGSKRPNQAVSVLDNCAFVVFNYDRCLEQYLYFGFKHKFNITFDEVASIIRTATILHPYGSLGQIPMGKQGGAQFGSDHVRISDAARNLQTFSEELSDKSEGAKLQVVMAEAERIVFLGFGFHDQNLKLLFPGGAPPTDMWGTMWLQQPRLGDVHTALGLATKRGASESFRRETCVDFLRRTSHLLFD